MPKIHNKEGALKIQAPTTISMPHRAVKEYTDYTTVHTAASLGQGGAGGVLLLW
jgi:hypothetical protein